MRFTRKKHSVLPGFGLALGFTLFYLSLVVLIPLSTLFWKSAEPGLRRASGSAVTAPRVVASYKLTFGASLVAAAVNAVFGLVVTWVLVRYRFPGRRLMDALVDLPVRPADGGRGHRAHDALRPERLAGRAARGARHQGRVHAARHHARPHVHRAAVRGAHAAAGAREPRPRGRGGGGQPGREPLADDLRASSCPRSSRPGSPASRWRSRARSASTARSSSSRATCR